MTGGTDDRLAAEQGPGGCQRTIFLAQVQANAQAGGQLGIIVDDQLSTVAGAELLQRIGLAQPPCLVAGLVSILQQAGAALQCRLDIGQQAAIGQQLAVGDGVQAAQAGRILHALLSSQTRSSGRRRGTNCPWPGASASRRVRQV